jgi:ankyrin repeat protein
MNEMHSSEMEAGSSSHLLNANVLTLDETEKLFTNPSEETFMSSEHHAENIVRKMRLAMYFIRGWPISTGQDASFHLGDVESVDRLIRYLQTDLHVTDNRGDTLLHQAVLSACQFADIYSVFYSCIYLLMNQQINLNVPNKMGYTAIGLAVLHLHRTCVQYMLQHPLGKRLHLDYYPGDSESTVREIIKEIYPELESLLPAPLMERLESSDRNIKLLAALQLGEYKVFCDNIRILPNPNPWYDEPYHSSLLEIACQMKNREKFVEILLEKQADTNIKNRVTGMPLIHATARSGSFEVLVKLLYNHKTDLSLTDNEDRTILHWLAGVSERQPGDKQKIENCLKLFLCWQYISRKSIDSPDSSGNTALITAVERGFQGRAKLLLSKGADITVFEHGSKVLLSVSLSILEEILNDCLLSNDKPVTSKELELRLNKELLVIIVPRIAESQHLRVLLTHPVISTFLNLKWQKIRSFFFLGVAFYITFLPFLTAHILYSESCNTLNNTDVANKTTSSDDVNTSPDINDTNSTSQPDDPILHFLWYFLKVFLISHTLREILHLALYRWVYILSLENLMDMSLIIATYLSRSSVAESTQVKSHLSAVALLLGWVKLFLLTGRLPQLYLKLEMLKSVSLTFLNFMADYVILLIAFALSFYILFKGSVQRDGTEIFANPFLSLQKTILMFAGEFEASSLSFETLPYTSHVIFLLFVFLVAIVLLNLLNGLAVSDTKAIRRNAETLSHVARVRLILKIETLIRAIQRWMSCFMRGIEEMCTLHPNRRNTIGPSEFRPLLSIITKKRQANKKWEAPLSQKKWRMFTEKLSALQLRQEILEKKLDEVRQILAPRVSCRDNDECEETRAQI